MTNARNIVIVGAGDFGRECASWLKSVPAFATLPLAGFLDDDQTALQGYAQYPAIVGAISTHQPAADTAYVMAISDPRMKLTLADLLESKGARFQPLVHPTAVLAEHVSIGRGVVMCPNVVVSTDASIGDFVAINIGCSIGHDVTIGRGATLSAHVDLTGRVRVEEGAFFGSHAVVLPGGHVGSYAKVGAGTVVLKRVRDGASVMGVPAKQVSP